MRRPLIYLLLAFSTGIFTGSYLGFCHYSLFILGVFNLVLILVSIRNKWLISSLAFMIIFSFLLGIFNIQKQIYFAGNDHNINLYIDKGKIAAEGVVIENPVAREDRNILTIRCVRIIKDNSYIPVSGNIRLVLSPGGNYQYGDFIRFHSSLKKVQNFNNPGNVNYERMMRMKGIQASGFIHDSASIILLRKNSLSAARQKLESFRSYLKEIIYRNASSPQREIIEAMTIGNQNGIPADVRVNFNKTGTSHILSISGLHIGMVGAAAYFFFFLIFRLSEYLMLRFNIIKLAAGMAFFVVLVYGFIAGMEITVMRAVLMAFVFLVALLSGKQKDLYSTLALAALIILLLSPEALFDISFQLSFLSVLGLIYIVPRFMDIPSKKIAGISLPVQNILRYIYISFIVSVAATLGTLPLIMYYFNSVSCITIVANLITVPLLGTLTLAICMPFIFFALFSPTIAGYFIIMASCMTQISIYIINKLAALPFSYFTSTTPGIIEIGFFYLFLFLFIQFIDERKKRDKKEKFSLVRFRVLKYSLLFIILFFVMDLIYLEFRDWLTTDLKVTVIDVGQGTSALIRFPGGKNMLIDGGGFSESTFDVGKSVVAPFLYHERINKIDTVVSSHPHPDHLLGLIYMLNNFSVRQVWKSNLQTDIDNYPEWEKAVRENNVEIYNVSDKSPRKSFDGVKIDILWPPDYAVNNLNKFNDDHVNDSSLVLKITFGNIKILFPGDISENVEKQLIQSGADLKSDVLMVPHHGSRNSSSDKFIRAVGCRYAVASAGKSNVFKHPHPLVLERYEDAGASVFRTDRDGAITFTTDGKILHVNTFVKSEKSKELSTVAKQGKINCNIINILTLKILSL